MRECAIAFAVLLVFLFTGNFLLELLALSDSSLNIAGGVILFLIALRMVFRGKEPLYGDQLSGEPFIVPLAIPAIAGPAAIATVILLMSRAARAARPSGLPRSSWRSQFTHIVAVRRPPSSASASAVSGFGTHDGLVLTAMAVQMLLRGIQAFVLQLRNL